MTAIETQLNYYICNNAIVVDAATKPLETVYPSIYPLKNHLDKRRIMMYY